MPPSFFLGLHRQDPFKAHIQIKKNSANARSLLASLNKVIRAMRDLEVDAGMVAWKKDATHTN
jgi:hypothetical protein